MSEAPNPPEKKTRNPVGSGLQAARERQNVVLVNPMDLLRIEPEVTVCKDDKLTGELKFDTLLVIQGSLTGKLIGNSQAGIVVGSTGILKANILNISAVLVQGTIIGNIGNCEAVILRSSARVHGDITCKTIEIEPGAVVVGEISVNPADNPAPIDATGNIVSPLSNTKSTVSTSKAKAPHPSTTLVLLEPQFDFHSNGGAMPLASAEEDTESFAELIQDHVHDIDSIVVILDTHQRPHIAQSSYWCNEDGSQCPPIYTTIKTEDVNEGKWRPKDSELLTPSIAYLQKLAEQKRYTLQIKPEHCLVESRGHAVVQWIDEALQLWSHEKGVSPIYVPKCISNHIDSTSFLAADTVNHEDPTSFFDPGLLATLKSAEKLIVCGIANAPSTRESIVDLINEWGPASNRLCIVKRGYVCEGASGAANDDDFWLDLQKNKSVTVSRPAEVFL